MTDPLIAAARFLTAQLPWLRHATDAQGQPVAADMFREIGDCAARMRRLVDPVTPKYFGPCGAETQELSHADPYLPTNLITVTCEGDVYGVAGAQNGRCRTCGATVEQEARRQWLDDEVRARAFRAVQIEEAYGIPAKTILSWRDRGQLVPHGSDGYDHRGLARPTFNVGDVLDLHAASVARREERRVERERRVAAREAREKAKHESAGYMTVHQRLRRERGAASDYPCSHCDAPALDWAYDHTDPNERPSESGPFSVDPERYKPLCRSCHQKLDATHRGKTLTS